MEWRSALQNTRKGEHRDRGQATKVNEILCHNNILANFSKTLDFACASRTQNQGFRKIGDGTVTREEKNSLKTRFFTIMKANFVPFIAFC